MTDDDLVLLDDLIRRHPFPAPRLTQDGEPDRLEVRWTALQRAYVAGVLQARDEQMGKS